MTNFEKIIDFLIKNHLYSFCDDCLSKKIGIFPRQQVNSICQHLVSAGKINREKETCSICSRQKLVNQIKKPIPDNTNKQNIFSERTQVQEVTKPWYWEGNIQEKLVVWLENDGYKIIDISDPIRRSPGVDIKALEPNGKPLWISVKGYPDTKSPQPQARHYFAEAIFDMILYRGRSNSVCLAIALPEGFATYKNLSEKVRWFRKDILPFDVYWISEDGRVSKE